MHSLVPSTDYEHLAKVGSRQSNVRPTQGNFKNQQSILKHP